MSPSPSSQLPIGLHFEQSGSETQDLGNCAIWDHTGALQAGNPKLRVSLSLKTEQRNIPMSLTSHLPRGLSPQAPSTSTGMSLQTKEKG